MSTDTAETLLAELNAVYDDFNSPTGAHTVAARALAAAENEKIKAIESIVARFADVDLDEEGIIEEEARDMICDMAYSMDYNTEYMDLSLEDGTVSLWKNSYC